MRSVIYYSLLSCSNLCVEQHFCYLSALYSGVLNSYLWHVMSDLILCFLYKFTHLKMYHLKNTSFCAYKFVYSGICANLLTNRLNSSTNNDSNTFYTMLYIGENFITLQNSSFRNTPFVKPHHVCFDACSFIVLVSHCHARQHLQLNFVFQLE